MKALAFATLLGAFALPASAAIQTVDVGSYTVEYEDANDLGLLSYAYYAGSNKQGLAWTLPDSLFVNDATTDFLLPSFTITANPGYTFTGSLNGFIGNLSYTEFGTGESGAWISGAASVDGSPLQPFYQLLNRTEQVSSPAIRTGYYSLAGNESIGSFSSLVVSGLKLTLSASSTAVVNSVGQGELRIELVAVPVPEADTYVMLLAGLGLLFMVARRRMPR